MPKKSKRCRLFDHCPLRTVYEMRGEHDVVKKYCRGDFRKCGRYKLEALGEKLTLGMQKKRKNR
jgi:hypothetical protein